VVSAVTFLPAIFELDGPAGAYKEGEREAATELMKRRLRIVACATVALACVAAGAVIVAYLATRQVRPFYEQALQIAPEDLEQGRRELESRATALYTDARQAGKWQALFTDDQINGWLAVQIADTAERGLPNSIRAPRIAIVPDLVTLGFTTKRGGVETVIAVDAAVFLTDDGDVAIYLRRVRAGALPLPLMMVAEEIAAACRELELPVRWAQQDGAPVAMIRVRGDEGAGGRQWWIDAIELNQGELYVAGHTEVTAADHGLSKDDSSGGKSDGSQNLELSEFELRVSRGDDRAALEIARRPGADGAGPSRRP
jgi:hypothetical protein